MRFRIGGYLWLLNSAMILMLVCIAVYSVFHLVQIHIALKEITYKDLPLTKLVSEVVEAPVGAVGPPGADHALAHPRGRRGGAGSRCPGRGGVSPV